MTIQKTASRLGLLATFALIGATTPAMAATLFSDTFENAGALVGSTPAVGANWAQTGTTITNPLTVTSGFLPLATSGQDVFGALSSPAPTTAGTKLFTGFNISLTAASATGDYFLHLSDPAGTTTNFYQRVYARSSGAGFQLGIASGSGAGSVITYGSTVLSFTTNYRVVSSWEFIAGTANDALSLYVDPIDPVDTNNTPYIGGYTWTGAIAEPTANVSAVNIRQGTAATAPTLSIDNLMVADTFSSVLIPEPGTMALIGLSLLPGIALLRRRK